MISVSKGLETHARKLLGSGKNEDWEQLKNPPRPEITSAIDTE